VVGGGAVRDQVELRKRLTTQRKMKRLSQWKGPNKGYLKKRSLMCYEKKLLLGNHESDWGVGSCLSVESWRGKWSGDKT